MLLKAYECNFGLCGKCHKEELRKGALRNAKLSVNDVLEMTERELFRELTKELDAAQVRFDYDRCNGSHWVVFLFRLKFLQVRLWTQMDIS